MKEQPVPSESRCPYCGKKPENIAEHRLSKLGYKHDDIVLKCENKHEWWAGVPIGEPDEKYWEDLWCESCESCFYRVKSLEVPRNGTIKLHVKCPNCYYVPSNLPQRDIKDFRGKEMVTIGFPDVTGDVEDAQHPTVTQ